MRKLRLIGAVLLVCALAASLAGCRGETSLAVGVDAAQVPLSFRGSDNSMTGFLVDMASEAAKRTDMTVSFVSIDWSAKDQLLSEGRVNCLWGKLGAAARNDDGILCTKAFMKNSSVAAVPSGSGIKDLAGLKDKSVGAIQGSTSARALIINDISSQLAGGAPKYYSDYNTLFSALGSGQIDAVTADKTMCDYFITQNTFDFKELGQTLSSDSYSVAVRRNDSRLRNSLQKALNSMYDDGTFKTLSKKWFGSDITVKPY